ncbi:MAG: bifunctional phosphoribosyl-AMP cyclohydrolase/phosphoribosyl-ATP diphosphatase HisIE [Vampirovibrionales bacterium]|nr:bifunctional phosphoribosyl-AMP cyclohydrolase/phosphoribosyl-ATP diphosphatase HisIE [Vampirovibrionales bacterium]
MIIPSIDLISGKAVQLRQGKELKLVDDRCPIALATEFNRYGEVAVIDLDAALSKGDNLELIRKLCRVADVRAGGGIRDIERARILLRAGAKQIIVGTAATPEFLSQLPKSRVLVALDCDANGIVLDKGWTDSTGETVIDRAKRLAPYCGGFLCTFVAQEGTMQGLPIDQVKRLQAEIDLPLTVAGGVATTEEASAIARLGVDVQVGMALYTGKLKLAESVINSLDFDKQSLIPTIVQDVAGEVLMLAYSSKESLMLALEEGRGIYFSRSRNEIWRKGETSGNRQTLLSCRTDCDRDALLFTVSQNGPACHTQAYSCFGSGVRSPRFSMPALMETLRQRQADAPENSYSAKLFAKRPMLLKKIMEEAYEVVSAPDRDNLVWEIADTLYFMSVLATAEGVEWQEVVDELGGRVK